MYRIVTTTRFEKDIKLAKKRGKDIAKLKKIIELLILGKKLPIQNRDHWLTGNYSDRRECHIEPDWLLIYKPEEDQIIFERIGTHSDLFR